MLIAARDNGFRAKEQERIVLDTVGRYRTAMAEFAGMKNLEVWYSHLDIESVLQELRLAVQAEDGQASRQAAREGADEGQHDGVLEADATSSTGRRGSSISRR